MVIVDDVIKKLDDNGNLSPEIKENLKELILIFNDKFPNVDLAYLNEKIGSLNITVGNKFLLKDIAAYNDQENTLAFNTLEVAKDYDIKNILMQQLLHIISFKNSTTGITKNNDYEGFHKGCAAVIANNLVGNDSEKSPYIEEEIMVNLLGNIVDFNVIEDVYFNNNYQPLVNSLVSMQNTPYEIKELMNMTKYNYETRTFNKDSQLGGIQKRLIAMFVKKPDLTQYDVNIFRSNLCGDSHIFGEDSARYKSVDGVYQYFDNVTANLSLNDPTLESKSR